MTIQENIPLAPYTTLKVGGAAEYFVDVETVNDLREAIAWAKEHALPVTTLAGGSNVLVADGGVRGLVVHIALRGTAVREEDERVLLTAGAGEALDTVVVYAVEHGWWGLENLSCIPGSCGATPVQNVGAYGVETADVLASVEVYDTTNDEVVTLAPEQCAFGYRDSLFRHPEGKRYIITRVTYALSRTRRPVLGYRDLAVWAKERKEAAPSSPPPSLAEIRGAVCAIRSRKFPDWTQVGTAGSFFKNPTVSHETFESLTARYSGLPGHDVAGGVKLSLGWVLDHVLGVRGVREGAVGTYDAQALVLITRKGANAREVDTFANSLAARVEDATGITIEREVTSLPQKDFCASKTFAHPERRGRC